MRETTDTNYSGGNYSSRDIPDGEHLLTVKSVERKTKGTTVFYIWRFDMGEQVLLPSMMAGLLRALGCTEGEPGKFDWDTDAQDGKQVWAVVSHKPDKKDPTKIRQHMGDFRKADSETAEVPF